MSSPLPPRQRVVFRPHFTLVLLYVAGFFVLFCLLLALPDLIAGARTLPAGQGDLTPEERALAEQIVRGALAGRIHWALAAAIVVVGMGAWTGRLPGLRKPY